MKQRPFFHLFEFMAKLSYADLPEQLVHAAKRVVVDTIGVMVGASALDLGRQLAGLHDLSGTSEGRRASAIGVKKPVSSATAAFINGSLAEVLEMQDGIKYGGVHPSSTVLPAILAIAQERRLSGEALILAIVAGYEFLGRIARLVYPQPFWRGFNMTGICGGFGAAMGCGKLLEFEAHRLAEAIGICGMYAPISSRGAFYSEIKPTHAGRASEAGLTSALLVERGISGSPDILDTKESGGICTGLIADCKDFSQVAENLGSCFEIENLYFKPFPSCRHTHGAIQGALEIVEKHLTCADEIAEVKVFTYDVAKKSVGGRRPTPNSPYFIRQFSIPYTLSAALVREKFGIEEVFGAASGAQEIYDFMQKVIVREDSEITNRYPETTPSRLEVLLNNDKRLTVLVERPKGDPECPMTDAELEKKFKRLVVPILGKQASTILLTDLMNLHTEPDVSNIMEKLQL